MSEKPHGEHLAGCLAGRGLLDSHCCFSNGHSQFDFKEGRFPPPPPPPNNEVNYCWPLANNWPGAGNQGESGPVIQFWLVGDKESWLELLRKVFFQNFFFFKGVLGSESLCYCAMPSPILPAFNDMV